jgi:hypothetical protein
MDKNYDYGFDPEQLTAKLTMENKTAKITRTVFVSDWAGPNGPVYYHEIELSNGDKGQIGSKEKMPAKLNPGSELTYTIEETSRGNKIKAVVENKGFKPGGGKQDPKQAFTTMGYSYAKDLVVAGKLDIKDFHNCAKDIFDNMNKLFNK